jgi:signal transduction histidine kinase
MPLGRVSPESLAGWAGAAVAVVVVYVVVVHGGDLLIGTGAAHVELSILATVIVAATIDRIQRRCEGLAARLLRRDGSKPYDVLAQFSSQVAGAEAAGELPQLMARLLAEGTAAAWAQVWVLVNGRPTLMATYPPEAAAESSVPAITGAFSADGLRSVAVGHAGRVLGVLRVRERDGHPLTAVESRLFAGLAAQAGLALHAAQLRAELEQRHHELTARAGQLRAARGRLVAAQDAERRRLEQDIHDGAQQQLVALRINLRLAQTLAERSPERAVQLLAQQSAAAEEAIATLRALSRGAEPEVLSRAGLPEALRQAAKSCPLPVTLDLHDVGRLPRPVETAVYFSCLEALQNVVKHAEATGVNVRLDVVGEALELEVVDDGRGLQPGAVAGSGFGNMRERLATVGGQLQIGAARESGTAVTAIVPAVGRIPSLGVGD